jgi:hypothetical protein
VVRRVVGRVRNPNLLFSSFVIKERRVIKHQLRKSLDFSKKISPVNI